MARTGKQRDSSNSWPHCPCKCLVPSSDSHKAIVQFYQVQDKTVWETISGKPKRKLPICLGALISDRHILTTKLCFGTMSESGYWQHTESIFSVFFSELIFQILQVPIDKVKVMYGLIYSYPHPEVSTNPFKVTDYKKYKRISSIKPSP